MAESMWATATLLMLDPRELLIDGNSRKPVDIAVADPDFTASVAKHGVRLPVIANPAGEGRYRIRDGSRRTQAAVLAVDVHPTIPVLVTDEIGDHVVTRLRDQWIANEIRKGFDAEETAAVFEQLTLCGLSADDIAEELSVSPDTVHAGLAVRASERATAFLTKNPQGELRHAAAFAEFDADPDAIEELEATLEEEPEQFDNTVTQLRYQRHSLELRDAKANELRADGVAVVIDEDLPGMARLHELHRSATDPAGLTEDNHRDCPGHALLVGTRHGNVYTKPVCTDWERHGHTSHWRVTTGKGRARTEHEKGEMRRARVNNEAWLAARDSRRDFVKRLFAAKTPPKQASLHTLLAMIHGGPHLVEAISRGSEFATELLGLKPAPRHKTHPIAAKAKRANQTDLQMLQLALVVGAWESHYDRNHAVNTWRSPTTEDQLYFTALRAWGHVLAPVEQLVLDPTADADKWPHLQTTTPPDTEAAQDVIAA
ncbi:ParB/RepB/Spo0J family partition protein [Actinokineospora sp. HUAS TT18]|uniref:ParB/RepB/Spo0J family partition protein n=1 Tax=Actinokineospora sp. HUAS TT18 TaxID=3447451 RepID=UPI003F5249A1